MVLVPLLRVVANPVEELMVATDVSEEVQVTPEVRVLLLPSLNSPVAVNCSVKPAATLAAVEVTAIDFSVAVPDGDEDFEFDELSPQPVSATNNAIRTQQTPDLTFMVFLSVIFLGSVRRTVAKYRGIHLLLCSLLAV